LYYAIYPILSNRKRSLEKKENSKNLLYHFFLVFLWTEPNQTLVWVQVWFKNRTEPKPDFLLGSKKIWGLNRIWTRLFVRFEKDSRLELNLNQTFVRFKKDSRLEPNPNQTFGGFEKVRSMYWTQPDFGEFKSSKGYIYCFFWRDNKKIKFCINSSKMKSVCAKNS